MQSSIITIAVFFLAALPAIAREVTECSCGFEDERTAAVYTDSIVLYFNETDKIDPAALRAADFVHKKEQGWNSRFKIGARSDNARIANITIHGSSQQALQMVLDPTDEDHLVNGASLVSVRRDIQYGLFEAAMKPAVQWTGGTVLTYGLYYNRSNGAGFDFMNNNEPLDARVSNFVNGEWPASRTVTNLTLLENAGLDPWNSFTNVRFSWNMSAVVFDIADNVTRLIEKKDRTLPTAGQALQIKTWSFGDKTYGQGPPMHNATQSHVLLIRAFFNSSVMTDVQHTAFDERCATIPRCPTTDMSLRGYTAFGPASERRWQEPPKNKPIRKLAGVVAACCSSFGIIALMNVFLRRTPWQKLCRNSTRVVELSENPAQKTDKCKNNSIESIFENGSAISGTQTPLPLYGGQISGRGPPTPAPSYHTTTSSPRNVGSSDSLATERFLSQTCKPDESLAISQGAIVNLSKHDDSKLQKALNRISEVSHFVKSDLKNLKSTDSDRRLVGDVNVIAPIQMLPTIVGEEVSRDPMTMVTVHDKQAVVVVEPVDEKTSGTHVTAAPMELVVQSTKRVDYLSGLTAVACIMVTLHHFGQTFWPYVMDGYGPTIHYPKVERWLHYIVGGIILSNLWIGPFFLTATRFLSTNYLKNGNLEDIAKKELRRAPRLFVPIIIVSLLQYFLISMGLTTSLQWLPSVTYSTWPYVVAQPNFAVYMNNIVELAYMIPNAVPEITSHYCIGVLWTVPVQLQYTYVVLGATVVIRDVKNTWKRFGVYTLVILAGWYARSWSACHWAGLVLSDLEATYQWREWLKTRPLARYTILSAASACVIGSTLFSVFNPQWSFDTAENSIHPDHTTGKPIVALRDAYPDYHEPTLAILLFSVGLQTVVELSTWVQAFLSLSFFVFLNPMIFCIYLTHGFVMWTWGAWVALACNAAGMPYWANLLVTLVTTYALILLLAWVMTPLLEFPTQALMHNIDRWTKEEPQAKRPTTAPFSKNLVLNRQNKESAHGDA